MNTPALILDFGGVISRTVFETHAQSEKALGLPPGTLDWLGPFDPENDPLWQSMQRDEITERDYWYTRARETGALVGESWNDLPTFLQRIRGQQPEKMIRPEARQTIIRAMSRGCKLAILSNELDLFYGAEFRKKLPLLDKFDLIVDATYTKILKPDPKAYQAVTRGLGCEPAQCVFVDDQQRNIEGAQAAGMQTVHFDVKNPARSYREAEALLGICSNSEEKARA